MTSTKETFQKLEAASAEKLKAALSERWLRTALEYSMAHFAHGSPSKEELTGVNRFLGILHELPEAEIEMPKLPKLELTSYDEPASAPQPKK